ncbi:MAG TPA: hypothetical protein VGH73_13640 [Thermoanaerobaculia bacterium]|jgi:hypothetical protein
MHRVVEQAINEIKAAFPGHTIEAVDDGQGGAFVRAGEVLFGNQYDPSCGWIAFSIGHTYPHADIYPHYLPGVLQRHDNKNLGEGFHKQQMALGPFSGAATMVSRRSNRWNSGIDTAALKLAKVLDWIRSRP